MALSKTVAAHSMPGRVLMSSEHSSPGRTLSLKRVNSRGTYLTGTGSLTLRVYWNDPPSLNHSTLMVSDSGHSGRRSYLIVLSEPVRPRTPSSLTICLSSSTLPLPKSSTTAHTGPLVAPIWRDRSVLPGSLLPGSMKKLVTSMSSTVSVSDALTMVAVRDSSILVPLALTAVARASSL